MKRIIFVFAFFLQISGCATNTIHSTTINDKAPLPVDHGVVGFQLINNTDRLSNHHKNWDQALIIRLDNSEELKQQAIEKLKAKNKGKAINEDKVDWDPDLYTLRPASKGVIDSQLFIGSMPAGRYAIAKLHSYYSDGNMSSWINMPVWSSAGEFVVKPAKVSNLGTLVFQPLLSIKNPSFWNSNSSQKAYVTRIDGELNLDRLIKSSYPQTALKIDLNSFQGWNEDDFVNFRQKLGQLSRENAYGDNALSLQELAVGAVTARFGQLKILQKDGSWLQKNLPTNGQISSAIELNGQLMVGSESGIVFVGSLADNDWKKSTPVPSTEAIVWLGQSSQQNYAVTSSAMQFKVYTFSNLTTPWKEIGRFKKKPANSFLVQNGGLFPIITTKGEVRIINDNKIHDYQASNQNWTVKEGEPLVKLSQTKNGILLGLEVSQWDGIGDQIVSYDDGDSWQTISRSLSMFGDNKTDASLPAALSNGNIVSIGRTKLNKKNKKSKSQLYIMTNEKANVSSSKTWSYHGLAMENCHTMLPELTHNSRLYFLCDKGDIVSTPDFGKSWKEEVNIDIEAMQADFEAMIEALNQSDTE